MRAYALKCSVIIAFILEPKQVRVPNFIKIDLENCDL